jgi:Ala-tRNA(Pro) deacylase
MMDLDLFLRDHGITAQRHSHPPVMTVEESERLVPKLPGAKTKNLFLRDKKGARHILATVPHDLPVDLNALGAALAAGRLGLASPERLAKHLGVTPALWDAPAVLAHPLVNDATLVIAHADLERFLAATGHAPRVIAVPSAARAAGSG